MKPLFIGALLSVLCGPLLAKAPVCTDATQGPVAMARAWLAKAGEVTPSEWDPSKATVTLLSSQALGKGLYRQVHLVLLAKANGEAVRVITVGEVTPAACTAANGDVYLLAQ